LQWAIDAAGFIRSLCPSMEVTRTNDDRIRDQS
jgi:hypothetical protein